MKIEDTRHSFAHLLAAAVKNLYPDAVFGIGPPIEDGFYYDFGNVDIGEDDLPKIEKEMKRIAKGAHAFKKELWTKARAKTHFRKEGASYKLELIDDLDTPKVGMVHMGKDIFLDLCRGGHVKNTNELPLDAFHITRVAGAYWRGDEKNPMLTRVYGVAFATQKELRAHEEQLKEAEARDHRKLGRELGLFAFSDLIGAGLPLFTPKGTVIRTELQNALVRISKKYGVAPVTIPHIGKRKLYELSGHAEKFGDELLTVKGHHEDFILKPVNCPHHTQIYASSPKSYRDLPVRFMESTAQYRDEKPGELSGLTRVRAITVDDGHVFCTPDHIHEEAKNIAHIIEEFYTMVGLWGKHWVSLSVRDPKTPDAYIGDDKDWKKAERMLATLSRDLKLSATRMEGEAALYGPKLDYMFRDSLGREWQLATIQIDFSMPKRFGLAYTDKDGKERTPIMIHRAILGSYERFMAILIEHFAGAFPLWLAPEQMRVIPISEKFNTYAHSVAGTLREADFRVHVDESDESLGKKIRAGEVQKIPYLLIVGEKEKKAKNVSVRSHAKGDMGISSITALVKKGIKERDDKT